MANEEQLAILKRGVEVWNDWRSANPHINIDLFAADLKGANLIGGNFQYANLKEANLRDANLLGAYLANANLARADFVGVEFTDADLVGTDLTRTRLTGADLTKAYLSHAKFDATELESSIWDGALMGRTILANSDLSQVRGLDGVSHFEPSTVSTDTFVLSRGKIPSRFLRGCGLSDWEIEAVKLYNPDLTNEERNRVLYRIYDLQASQAIQVSPLFISYSHANSEFVDKLGKYLQDKGIRYWRDIHEMKAGRIETQIDRGIRQNPTVLLILSEHSLSSDWVEHEVRTARGLEKENGRDVLCPVALDDSWKSSRWPKRLMEQIMEYNILDFSAWNDDSKFDHIFRKLVDGLELFYTG